MIDLEKLEKLAKLDWVVTGGQKYMPVNPETILKLIAVVRRAKGLHESLKDHALGNYAEDWNDWLGDTLKALETEATDD